MAMEAKEYGMSLSEYAEVIASTRHDSGSNQEQQELLKEIKSLKAKIGFYESDLLRKHLEANRGEINHFTDSLGNHREIQITSLEDIYTVIINSIKLRS